MPFIIMSTPNPASNPPLQRANAAPAKIINPPNIEPLKPIFFWGGGILEIRVGGLRSSLLILVRILQHPRQCRDNDALSRRHYSVGWSPHNLINAEFFLTSSQFKVESFPFLLQLPIKSICAFTTNCGCCRRTFACAVSRGLSCVGWRCKVRSTLLAEARSIIIVNSNVSLIAFCYSSRCLRVLSCVQWSCSNMVLRSDTIIINPVISLVDTWPSYKLLAPETECYSFLKNVSQNVPFFQIMYSRPQKYL